MKRPFSLFLTAAVFVMVAVSALAAGLYPSGVIISEDGQTIEKVYRLTDDDDPETIPTGDFERGGILYTLADLLKQQTEQTDEIPHAETVTLPANSGELSEALKLFEPTMDFTGEDGYAGKLTLDHTTVKVSADGYKNSSWTVSATRTYPNLSAADLSLVPKTIEDSGRTLTLADVSWSAANTENVDGYALPERYTATVTYTGTASSWKATGWTAIAEYTGTLTRTVPGPVEYTAVFIAAPVTPEPEPSSEATLEPTTEATSTPEPEATAPSEFNMIGERLVLVLLVAALFGLGLLVSRRNKKRKKENEQKG